MLKKLIGSGVGLLFLASPLLASADTLSDLLAQLQSLQAQIATLKAQIIVQAAAPALPMQSRACPALLRNLVRGMRGDDVLRLQAHLGVSQTGFFGPATEAAVQKLQMEVGIAAPNAGAPAGYGQIGPRTRAAIALRCSGNTNNIFTVSPASGTAPLNASFHVGDVSGQASLYTIDFGDGATSSTWDQSVESGSLHQSHTYTSAGTYTATLFKDSGVCEDLCMNVVRKKLGTVTITVGGLTGASETVTLSASPTSGSAPLDVGFSYPFRPNVEMRDLTLYFGDGTSNAMHSEVGTCTSGAPVGCAGWYKTSHTYTSPGVYTARLLKRPESGSLGDLLGVLCNPNEGNLNCQGIIVGTATITVRR